MKLKTYAKKIAKLAEKHPDAKVIYAIDDEGNDFRLVLLDPTPGHFDDDGFKNEGTVNAVCVN
jgi:hypothetical protein